MVINYVTFHIVTNHIKAKYTIVCIGIGEIDTSKPLDLKN